jgi:predicted negative regulator of RcsB-dependent stress response
MLKPKKKIVKKELKQDKLISTYAQAVNFYDKNKKYLSIGVVVLALAIFGIIAYQNNQTTNNEKASAELAKVIPFFDAGNYRLAVDGAPEMNVSGLKALVDNFGGTVSGNHARFYLASSLFQLGEYDAALEEFSEFDGEGEMLQVSRLSGIAACYEAKKDFRRAAEYYESAGTLVGTDVAAPENLSNAARNFALSGDKEKAIELYEKVKKNHPTTVFGREADRFITQLSFS